MKKKILFSAIIFLSAVAAGSILVMQAGAGTEHSSRGFIKSFTDDGSGGSYPCENGHCAGAGYISMNSQNCDSNGDGISDNGNPQYGCPVGIPVANYGVHILNTDNNLSGYAWSSNVGWIDFAPAPDYTTYPGNGYPAAPYHGAKKVGDDHLEGWARVVSIKEAFESGNSGGWEGWISLKGGTQENWKCTHSAKTGNNYLTKPQCQSDCPSTESFTDYECIPANDYYKVDGACDSKTLVPSGTGCTDNILCPSGVCNWGLAPKVLNSSLNYEQLGTKDTTCYGVKCSGSTDPDSTKHYSFHKRIGVEISGSSVMGDLGRIKGGGNYLYFRTGNDGSDTFDKIELKGFSSEIKDINLGAYAEGVLGANWIRVEGKLNKLNINSPGRNDFISISGANASGSAQLKESDCATIGEYDKKVSVKAEMSGNKKLDFKLVCRYFSKDNGLEEEALKTESSKGIISFGDICPLENPTDPDKLCSEDDPPTCDGTMNRFCWQQTSSKSYGVKINTNTLSGNAWSGSTNGSAGELGYISFDGASIECDPTGGTNQYFWGTPVCAPTVACGTTTTINDVQCYKKDSCGGLNIEPDKTKCSSVTPAPTVTCNANCSGGWKEVNP